MSASCLDNHNGGKIWHPNRRRSIDGSAVPELSERIASPAEHLTRRRPGTRVHGTGGDGREIGARVHARWLRTIARAGRELAVVVAAPTKRVATGRDRARVLVACRDRDESEIRRHPNRRPPVIVGAVTDLTGVVGAPTIEIAARGDATGVIPPDRKRGESQVTSNLAGP
jgi:hypothetical protein